MISAKVKLISGLQGLEATCQPWDLICQLDNLPYFKCKKIITKQKGSVPKNRAFYEIFSCTI